MADERARPARMGTHQFAKRHGSARWVVEQAMPASVGDHHQVPGGSTLARRFAGVGHEISIGTRDAGSERIQALLADLPPSSRPAAGSIAEITAQADLLVLTTPWDGAEVAVRAAGDFANKVVID